MKMNKFEQIQKQGYIEKFDIQIKDSNFCICNIYKKSQGASSILTLLSFFQIVIEQRGYLKQITANLLQHQDNRYREEQIWYKDNKKLEMQNNHSVQKFYDDVFEDFKNRLFIAYRFKSTISSEQIDKFSKIVKQKMHRKREIFETGIRLSLQKRTPESKQHSMMVQNNGSKVKLEHQEEDNNYYRSTVKETILENQHEDDSNQEEESEDDDLNEFKKEKEPQSEVKKQEPEEKQEAHLDDDSEELYEEEDRKKEEILSKSEKKICAHIIASYGTKNKKHIPKVQKTKIDLENVFIRTADKELFYAKIQCDLEQAIYKNIKL